MDNFYNKLVPFDKFEDFTKACHSTAAPSDFFLVLTDVLDSTAAIKEGRYKDVNTIGAACIAMVESVVGADNFAFVFGGDGASFLISPYHIESVKKTLCETRNSSKLKFNLDLRVSVIPLSYIKSAGFEVNIAKFRLSNKKCVAKFSGGGLAYAETLMKTSSEFDLKDISSECSSFKNLSCRWQPVKNQNGKILTLIFKSHLFKNYEYVANEIMAILNYNIEAINPIKPDYMSYESLSQIFRNEKGFESSFFSIKFLMRLLEIFMCSLIFGRFKAYVPAFLNKYIKAMSTHSDFRKFDDTLRMVVDCSVAQGEAIEKLLKSLYLANQGYYGIHESESALMTCLVTTIKDGDHLHFIDGDNGGYAMAAQAMKNQLKALPQVG